MTEIKVRRAGSGDADACGQIIYAAFGSVNERHGYTSRWPSAAFAADFARDFITNPGIDALVAEDGGDVVGCNFVDLRGPVHGVGPTAVSPQAQGRGVGRALMQGVMGADGTAVRLLQDSFNTASLSLYASLGFEVKEPVALMTGRPRDLPGDTARARAPRGDDLDACAKVCRAVHGFDRVRELEDAMRGDSLSPLVLTRDGRITAYASGFGTFAHAVAESERDMRALILGGAAERADRTLEYLLPVRDGCLFEWSLQQGFEVVKTMKLMARGPYREPAGSWLPSVLY